MHHWIKVVIFMNYNSLKKNKLELCNKIQKYHYPPYRDSTLECIFLINDAEMTIQLSSTSIVFIFIA